jgi:hypothetical protein
MRSEINSRPHSRKQDIHATPFPGHMESRKGPEIGGKIVSLFVEVKFSNSAV